MKKMKFSKALIGIAVLSAMLFCQTTFVALAAEPEPGVSILKVERLDKVQMPSKFRTSNDAFKKTLKNGKIPSREGMDTLYVSGSSIFSQLEFAKMLTKLPTDRLIVVDLRLESHGYLDGMEVSWYGAYNRANLGKSAKEVEALEKKLLQDTLNGPVSVAELNDDKSIASTLVFNVKEAMTEAELADRFGVKYYRIQCADYARPSDENVDQFLQFYKTLPKDTWLHFHCHAGSGRTTTFMAMVDMIKNANQVSYEDIIARQYLIGGRDIHKVKAEDPLKQQMAEEREKFTQDFYDYVKANPDLSVSWSEWIKKH